MLYAHDGADDKATCESRLESQSAQNWNGQYLVLDTNVLLNDPYAIFKFPGAKLIISGTVLEELDGKKGDANLGWAAREILRTLWKMAEKNPEPKDIPLGLDATLTLDFDDYSEIFKGTSTLDPKKKDNEILALAKAYAKEYGDDNVVVISNDSCVLIKARGLQIGAQQFEHGGGRAARAEAANEVLRELEITDAEMKRFNEIGFIRRPVESNIAPNEFVKLKSPSTPASDTNVVRYHYQPTETDPEKQYLHALPKFDKLPFPPLNLEQHMALDVLFDPSIQLVILDAKAGTGKTFLTMMAAYQQYQEGVYRQIYVSKPAVELGERLGFLPGNLNEKYEPWMQPYIDNLTQIKAGPKSLTKDDRKNIKRLEDLPKGFEILPFAHLRGRTLPDSLIVIDEFQNTTEHEAKTILTRAGQDTKVIVIGDPTQIDISPTHMSPGNNGLSLTARAMTNPKLSLEERSMTARVRLVNGVRSPLAELSSKAFDGSVPLD